MKRLCTVILLSFSIMSPALGQLVMTPGQSWSFVFDQLPPLSSPLFPLSQPGGVLAPVVSSSQPGSVLRMELFENSLSESPLTTIHFPLSQAVNLPNIWQDGQGAVRLTLVAGGLTLQSARVQYTTPNPAGGVLHFGAIVPVPEPSVATLALGGLALMAVRRLMRRGMRGSVNPH